MKILPLRCSLAFLYYSFVCFFIQTYSNMNNLKEIRLLDSLKDNQISQNFIIFLLIIVSLTLIFSTISNFLNLFDGFGNSIENDPISKSRLKTNWKLFPYLTTFDIVISILILLPKLMIDTHFILLNIKPQSDVFESSIDFMFGKGMNRVNKNGLNLYSIDSTNLISSQFINFLLILIRLNFIYSNSFYQMNKCLSLIMMIHSHFTIILSLFIYSIFEIYFKQISMINSSMNIYSYLLIFSLFISIFFVLITNHSLFYYVYFIYLKQQNQLSNQLIRLSNLDDRFLKNGRSIRPLLIYLMIVMLSVLCQFPYLILTLKYLLSNLIDYLLIIYLCLLIGFVTFALIIFTFLCFCPFQYFHNENYYEKLNENEQTKSFETFSRLKKNIEEKEFYFESPRLIPTRSISSAGLTVIDYQNSSLGRKSHQTSGITTDAFLVMH